MPRRPKELTPEAMRMELRMFVAHYASTTAAAQALGISPQYLWELLRDTRPLSDTITHALGYQRITRYVRQRTQEEQD